MRIMWSIHLYPPIHNCGAEYVAHNINKYLLKKGHDVRILNLQSKQGYYSYEGVDVFGNVHANMSNLDIYRWADVVLTHLDFTKYTINVAQIIKKPVVHFVHNSFKYPEVEEALKPQSVVYNSNWIRDELNYSHPGMVLYPPCPIDEYSLGLHPKKGEYITLINLNENKGGWILYRLAKEMPNRKFLGVVGSYDDGGLQPTIVKMLEGLPNVKVVPHSNQVKQIYQQTRILLVPSRYESWGRVATEAMINGIPVIACPTKGLIENCKGGATFVNPRGNKVTDQYGDILSHDGDTYDISLFKFFIEELDKKSFYEECAVAGWNRAIELETACVNQLNQLEKFLQDAKQNYRH